MNSWKIEIGNKARLSLLYSVDPSQIKYSDEQNNDLDMLANINRHVETDK